MKKFYKGDIVRLKDELPIRQIKTEDLVTLRAHSNDAIREIMRDTAELMITTAPLRVGAIGIDTDAIWVFGSWYPCSFFEVVEAAPRKKMTVEEIEDELGYLIEVVDNHAKSEPGR